MTIRITGFTFLFCVALTACAPNVSPDTYSVGSVGQVNRSVAARVISAGPVAIAGNSGAGGVVGAGAGAVAGSAIGSGARSNIIGAIGGAVVGGLAGAAIEGGSTKQTGIEYVVQTENDNLMTIVQGAEPAYIVGQKVLVLYGSPARLIADPRG